METRPAEGAFFRWSDRFLDHATAVALAALATASNLALSGHLRGPTLLFPVTAITLAALKGGAGVGLLASALSLAGHAYFVLEPRRSFHVAHRSDLYRLILLVCVSGLMVGVAASLRRALRRAETECARAQASAEIQDRLVAVVSHDLRNPLAAIATGIGLLFRTPGLDERQVVLLTRLRGIASRMERLIRDLLDFSRARQSHGLPARAVPANMDEIVERAVLEVLIANPGADVQTVTEGDQGGAWDPARMEQAISNLLSNAIQHGTGSAVRVRSLGAGGKVVLEVESVGRPIPAEQQAVLFEPFRQGEVDHLGHLGLGLFIVREIARAHGGTVAVSSTPSGLTTFRMELPQSPAC